jgi:branched-subunit amino acid ABC-type transport system permease component
MNDVVTFTIIGLAAGALYGLAAVGLVITFRMSGVFNFAHGAVAAVGAYAFFELRAATGWPVPVVFAVCVVGGGVVLGTVLEVLARSLVGAPSHLGVVATVGLLLAVEGLTSAWFGTEARFVAPVLPRGSWAVAGVRVRYDAVILLAVTAVAVVAAQALIGRSRIGLQMRAVVADEALAAAAGIAPHRVRRTAWMVGTAFAVASGILLAPAIGLEPLLLAFLVVQAFGAAAAGRFTSLPGTYAGGLLVGVAAALASRFLPTSGILAGVASSVPFLVLFAVLVLAPPRALAERHAIRLRSRPRRLSGGGVARPALLVVMVAALVALAVPPIVGAKLAIFVGAAGTFVVLLSLAVLVNVAGQVSLCHAAFAAVGATTFSHAASGWGLPWPVALVVAGLAAVPLGALLAFPAARLSSLALGLATFGFGVLMERMVYGSSIMFGAPGLRSIPRPGMASLGGDRGFFAVVVAVAALAAVATMQLQRGAWGRLVAAMADAPVAVTACGASLHSVRIAVFCFAAFLAGVGGALVGGATESVAMAGFPSLLSLMWLAVLTIGGPGVTSAAFRGAMALALTPAYAAGLVGPYQLLVFGVVATAAALLRGRRAAVLV